MKRKVERVTVKATSEMKVSDKLLLNRRHFVAYHKKWDSWGSDTGESAFEAELANQGEEHFGSDSEEHVAAQDIVKLRHAIGAVKEVRATDLCENMASSSASLVAQSSRDPDRKRLRVKGPATRPALEAPLHDDLDLAAPDDSECIGSDGPATSSVRRDDPRRLRTSFAPHRHELRTAQPPAAAAT